MSVSKQTLSATELIQAAGQRATSARIAVLDILLAAEYALSHHEIEKTLAQKQHIIDRVTLYRVLDWALQKDLAHKLIGDDRVWRYNAAPNNNHAHFYCNQCDQIYCLESLTSAPTINLPTGFKLQHAEVAIQGLCRHCGGE